MEKTVEKKRKTHREILEEIRLSQEQIQKTMEEELKLIKEKLEGLG